MKSVARFAAVVAILALSVAANMGVAAGQESSLDEAVLPPELAWQASKTQTVVEPPSGIPAVPIGVQIDGVLPVLGGCGEGSCTRSSAISLWPQTPFEEVPSILWVQDGASWTLAGEGSFVSASYPDGTTCVYLRTESWAVEVVEAVFDGQAAIATRLEGTFERGDVLDIGRSVGDVGSSCPAYEARDLWSVVATADVVAAVATPEPTATSEATTPTPGPPPDVKVGAAVADPEPSQQVAVTDPGSGSSGGNAVLIAVVVVGLVALAGGTAARIWMGSWWGRDGCTVGCKRNCRVTRMFFLPYDEDLGAVGKFDQNLAHVSGFAKTIAVISMVMNPAAAAAAMPLTAARAAQSASITQGLANAFQRGRDQQVDRLGWDVYVQVTWQCCKEAFTGTYWETCSEIVFIAPPDSVAAMDRTDNSGWKSTLPTTSGLIDMLRDEVNRIAPNSCQNCC